LSRRAFAVGVALAAVAGVTIGVALHARLFPSAAVGSTVRLPALYGQATWSPASRPAPSFALRDQRGRLVSLASLRGRTVALTFLDSLCRQACPVEGRALAAALRGLGPSRRPRLVVVSVDPGGDTPATVGRAIRRWGLPAGTTWLLGTHAQLARVWRAFRITVEPRSGDIVHSTALYLLDRHGDERAGFLFPFVPAFVTTDLRRLAA